MNRVQIMRETAPHVVIALAVCIGGWMALVQPKLEALGEFGQLRTGDSVRLTPEQQWQLVSHLENAQEWLGTVHSLNELSRDSNLLFSTIMQLAEDHDVQVTTIQPGAASRQTARTRPRTDEPEVLALSQLEIVVRGRFEKVASFVDSIADQSEFIRPRALEIAPADGPSAMISARLLCDLLIFTPPPALATLKGKSDAS